MAVLNTVLPLTRIYRGMEKDYADFAKRLGTDKILDIASGSAGPTDNLLRDARRSGLNLPKIVVSDLFPQPERWQQLKTEFGEEAFAYIESPFSFADAARGEFPAVSIITALHHLRPEDAAELLQDMVRNGKSIFIAEPYPRSGWDLFRVFLPLALPLAFFVPFLRPMSFAAKLCCFSGITPFMIYIDGLVSVCRIYNIDEISAMLTPELSEKVIISAQYYPAIDGIIGGKSFSISIVQK
ncbi:MAG: hypothetical protein PHC51_02190 [bacterium]|nr:hypothetical protein [bacterium]